MNIVERVFFLFNKKKTLTQIRKRFVFFYLSFMSLSLHTLPLEIIYHILDKLDDKSLFLSMRNVCQHLNLIIDSYHRYQITTTFELTQEQIDSEAVKNLARILHTNTV